MNAVWIKGVARMLCISLFLLFSGKVLGQQVYTVSGKIQDKKSAQSQLGKLLDLFHQHAI